MDTKNRKQNRTFVSVLFRFIYIFLKIWYYFYMWVSTKYQRTEELPDEDGVNGKHAAAWGI